MHSIEPACLGKLAARKDTLEDFRDLLLIAREHKPRADIGR